MERGLLWLPLLGVFCWLAWAGWNEYQKIEAYRRWATKFDRHKYDIYAVLGQAGDELTWGKPTRNEPVQLQTISLRDIRQVNLKLDGRVADVADTDLPPRAKAIALELIPHNANPVSIPFTDAAIALDWYRYLYRRLGAK